MCSSFYLSDLILPFLKSQIRSENMVSKKLLTAEKLLWGRGQPTASPLGQGQLPLHHRYEVCNVPLREWLQMAWSETCPFLCLSQQPEWHFLLLCAFLFYTANSHLRLLPLTTYCVSRVGFHNWESPSSWGSLVAPDRGILLHFKKVHFFFKFLMFQNLQEQESLPLNYALCQPQSWWTFENRTF